MMPSTLPVIVNIAAGKGHGTVSLDAIREAFRAAGRDVDILPARDIAELESLSRRAAAEAHPTIVAAGGDGTLSAVAAAIVDSPSALGVLPLGTLNHFARDLRIPLVLEEAARTIAAGNAVMVDVGEVNGRVFINNSSIGLYPTVVLHRKNQQRRLGRSKWQAFFWATLTVLGRHPMLDVRLSLDDVPVARRTPLVFVGNNDYMMEGFQVGTRGRFDAGRLCVYLTQRQSRWALIRLGLHALFGTIKTAKQFESLTARTVSISTRHARLPVATDGEVTVMAMPLNYRIRRGALKVIVPLPEAQNN
ncbi:MAG: diacylglycerol kinase family lipid kinase [Planctomycetes bacterium]|nr:diacylglycerol kinase family lipid kinase [Planctomycetota bacterium]